MPCDFSEYDYEALVATCSCKAKKSEQSFADMTINKENCFILKTKIDIIWKRIIESNKEHPI